MNKIIKPYTQLPFLLCFAVLALAAGFKEAAIEWSGAKLKKLPIPLRKSLDDLDESKLTPYRVGRKLKIDNRDMLESLGTEDYIQWELEDTGADALSSTRYCSLFITYYTGDPDRVPHVPEECFTGAGNQLLSRQAVALTLDIGQAQIAGLRTNNGKVAFDARYLVFTGKNTNAGMSDLKYSVLYFFKANGKFASSRAGTRAIMGKNLFGTYSYFSKVEWKFYGIGPGSIIYGNKADVLSASEKLISVLLPLLETEHWPDWEKANRPGQSPADPVAGLQGGSSICGIR